MKREKARIASLRNMPYEEYLHTPEWQETQKATLLRAKNQCQGCKAENVPLSVYHTTYDNLGCEQEDDLVALCEACSDHLVHSVQLTGRDVVPTDPGEEKTSPDFSLGAKVAVFAPAAVVGLGLPALLHAPLPAEIFGLVAALALAANSPKIYAEVRESLPAPLAELIDGMVARKRARAQRREWNTWDRLMGRHLSQSALCDEQERSSSNEQVAPTQGRGREKSPKLIALAPDINSPLADLAGKSIFIVGMRRSGKTTLGVRIAEQLGKYLIPMLIPDLEGDWLSLAEVLPRGIIFHGPKKDASAYGEGCYSYRLPLDRAEETGYAILEKGYQALLDLDSYATLDEAILVQIALIKGLFRWSETHPHDRTTCQIFLDEAQRFLPEKLDNSIVKEKAIRESLLDLYRDLSGVGGKRGLSPLILSQRFAETNKKIIAQTEVYFILRQTSDNDLDRVMEYVRKATATREQISAIAKGQGIYYATDGTQILTRFFVRESDGSRSHTPSPETAQRYAAIPMQTCDFSKDSPSPQAEEKRLLLQPIAPASGSVEAPTPETGRMPGPSTHKPTRVHREASDTLLLPPPPGVSTRLHQANQVQVRERPQKASESLTGLRHPGAGLPKVLRDALLVYEPGMTYRDLGAALGYGDSEARELISDLRRRGLLCRDAQPAHKQQQPRQLYPVPVSSQKETEPETASLSTSPPVNLPASQISQVDLARAYAYHQQGHNTYRKLYDVAYPAHGWSEKKCRALISEMEGQGLIQVKRRGQG